MNNELINGDRAQAAETDADISTSVMDRPNAQESSQPKNEGIRLAMNGIAWLLAGKSAAEQAEAWSDIRTLSETRLSCLGANEPGPLPSLPNSTTDGQQPSSRQRSEFSHPASHDDFHAPLYRVPATTTSNERTFDGLSQVQRVPLVQHPQGNSGNVPELSMQRTQNFHNPLNLSYALEDQADASLMAATSLGGLFADDFDTVDRSGHPSLTQASLLQPTSQQPMLQAQVFRDTSVRDSGRSLQSAAQRRTHRHDPSKSHRTAPYQPTASAGKHSGPRKGRPSIRGGSCLQCTLLKRRVSFHLKPTNNTY